MSELSNRSRKLERAAIPLCQHIHPSFCSITTLSADHRSPSMRYRQSLSPAYLHESNICRQPRTCLLSRGVSALRNLRLRTSGDLALPFHRLYAQSNRGYAKVVILSPSPFGCQHCDCAILLIMQLLYTLLVCFLLNPSNAQLALDSGRLRILPHSALPSTLPPVTTINIVNKVIAPDGFARS